MNSQAFKLYNKDDSVTFLNFGAAGRTARDRAVADCSREQISALETAITENRPILVNWLRRKLGNDDSAEDLAQQVFLRAVNYAGTNEIAEPRALLFKIAANLVINEYRRRAMEAMHFVPLDDDAPANAFDATKAESQSPEFQLLHKQQLQLLKAAIDALPERQRTAFVMNRFEGKTYPDIAAVMQVSVSTIEKYMMEALRQLRDAAGRTPLSPGQTKPANPNDRDTK
ncbi:RNA polymerase sigma factor [Gimibacter soli]|uniref:RNA polymerase sigma factor n=1 Tax=Gimibacter soli TaxID=3024400 RepID=A0AAF0BJK0_9PROT|nr:RNA polymerase sigma factor [Gimibacter soli]WCL53204.1 RNA polymerase sigma factor [Gimibacter soli]